ncbi:MAG: polysaccharide export protein [Magnetococcales bacterium]|nr:polysaccharide export protein [Magnetococcales bacterium]
MTHLLWLVILLLLPHGAFAVEPRITESYQLGPNDGLTIKVDDEPDLALDGKVSAQGTIYFAFLGEVEVAGLTARQLQKKLEERLADGYLLNPRVNVTIKEYRTVFVQGEVKTPGGYPFQPNLTVRKAVVLAGGFTDTANKDRVTVIRENDAEGKERSIGLDDVVQPGDVLTVQESFW